jgi:methyl-accepting chemotaxis protein
MVTVPLRRVTAILERISNGDFTNLTATKRQDEIGALLAALDTMQQALTKRGLADQRFAEETRRLTNALDQASTSLMITDREGVLVYANKASLNLLREAERDIRQVRPAFNAVQIIGSHFSELHEHPEQQQAMLDGLRGTYVHQMRLGPRTFRLVASPILDAEGERLGTVIEWVDRTADVVAESELDELLDAVAHGDFSRRISLEGKEGVFLDLAEGMNNLCEIVSTALDDLARVLKAMAEADLTQMIESRYKGRFAELKHDTNATVSQLEQLVTRIREATDAINTASHEIAAGNADLSERTEQQASSLEETSSSMEQFSASIQHTADNTSSAQTLVREANDKAVAGGAQVARVVETMSGIQASSHQIAEIVGMIDSIAFQTNILALNAAVEAAQAGEQGRGFAVVAGEVRNLAQRSAQAAKEIKTLIGESVAKVDAGAQLVHELGTTMESIVDSFQQVVGLVTEVAEAGREQGAGVDQMNQAIQQMDDVAQRNASLVEEAAAAAASLEEQAQQLRATIAVFHLSAEDVTQQFAVGQRCEDVDFDEFVYLHKQWSKRLRRVLEGRSEPQDPEVAACDDRCSLGEWIYGEGQRFERAAAYQKLREKHAAFHQCAGDILRHVIKGEADQADQTFSKRFGPLSRETIAEIRRLEQECQRGHLAKAATG